MAAYREDFVYYSDSEDEDHTLDIEAIKGNLRALGLNHDQFFLPPHIQKEVTQTEAKRKAKDDSEEYDEDMNESLDAEFPKTFRYLRSAPAGTFGVHLISEDGNIIATFTNAGTASTATGTDTEEILDVVRGIKAMTSNGQLYVFDVASQNYQEWVYGLSVPGEDSDDADGNSSGDEDPYGSTTASSSSSTLTGKRKQKKDVRSKMHAGDFQVEKFALNDGGTINTFSDYKRAMARAGVWNVLHVCLGLQKSAGGFGWRFIGDNAAAFLEYRVEKREAKVSAIAKALGMEKADFAQMLKDKTRNANRLRAQRSRKNLIAAAAMPGEDGDSARMQQDKTRNANRLRDQTSRKNLIAAAAMPGEDGDSARMQQEKTRNANRLRMQKKRRAASGATGEVGQEETREAHVAKSRKKAKKEAVAESAGEEI